MFPKLKLSNCLIAFFSSAFQAFGIYHVHNLADVTEGGVLGLTLLLEHWLHISPAITGAILNGANEAAVAAFLQEKIPFGAITRLVEAALERVGQLPADSLEDIYHADQMARRVVAELLPAMQRSIC